MKWLVFLGAAVIGFLVAFAFTARDEIGEEVDRRLDEDFVSRCVARAQFPPELEARAPQICACMQREFAARGLELTDALGEARAEMQRITRECVGGGGRVQGSTSDES